MLLSGSRTRAKRLAEDLRDYNLSSFYSDDLDREVEPGQIMTAYGHVAEGTPTPSSSSRSSPRRTFSER